MTNSYTCLGYVLGCQTCQFVKVNNSNMPQDSLISKLFPVYPMPGLFQRLLFVSLAIILGILEVTGSLVRVANYPSMWALAILVILLASCGWFSPWSDIAYTVFFDCLLLSPLSDNFSFAIWGICAISINWIRRSWIIPGLAIFFSAEFLSLLVSSTPKVQFLSLLLDSLATLSLGFFLRWQYQRMERMVMESQQTKEEAERSGERIRRELAAELHDTIAKDLARLVIVADRIAKHPDEAKPQDFKLVSDIAKTASRRIRPVIFNLDTTRVSASLTDVLDDVRNMLRTREMVLEADANPDLDSLLTRQQRQLATLVVREASTNSLKYAPAGAHVNLELRLDENRILTITMSNPVSEFHEFSGVTGGFGLRNLESRLNDESGELLFGRNSQGWIITALIPAAKEES